MKEEDIKLYSNPNQVYKDAKKLYGKNVEFDLSTRKDKKYMIKNPNTNKWVHFGQMYYEDFSKHKDIKRMERFRIRNHKWADVDRYSPAYMSYHLLW